jgi:hypothetical protein
MSGSVDIVDVFICVFVLVIVERVRRDGNGASWA